MKNNPLFNKILIALACLILLGGSLCAAFYFGILHMNYPELNGYTIKGVDVSSYQGDIDWDVLSSQGIEFAYIKATEGSSTVDRCFEANWQGASKTDLRIGAYHFFSFESSGENQAKLFCGTVKALPDMLPPVIDVEFYGSIVKDDFTDCGIWYRSVYSKIPSGIKWTIWQYSNRHVLKGYNGSERYIDMNVISDKTFLNK